MGGGEDEEGGDWEGWEAEGSEVCEFQLRGRGRGRRMGQGIRKRERERGGGGWGGGVIVGETAMALGALH